MRAAVLALFAASMFLTLPIAADASSATAESRDAHDSRPDDTWADRWQGRNHYLFDDENRPGPASTTGAASPETSSCETTSVRVRRADGSTALRRISRCE